MLDCSDLACVSNSQSSCVVAEKWLHCVVLLHDKLFSASMTNYAINFIVTNLALALAFSPYVNYGDSLKYSLSK